MSQAMRFAHLRLRNWRNFSHVDVALSKRMFVVGPNAIGKSNLLDVFRFLRELTLEGGGLSQAIRARRGLSRLRSLHQKGKNSDVQIEVTAVTLEGSEWRYLLTFNRAARGNDTPIVSREEVWHRPTTSASEKNVLMRPTAADRADSMLLTQTAMQQVTQNRGFRPLVDFLSSVSYLHLVPQLIREGQSPLEDAIGGDPFGRDLLSRIRGTPGRTQLSRLGRIKEVLKIAVPYLDDLELVLDENSRPHLQAAFNHWRGPAAKQDEREFSDGTLRLIGFLWALQEKSGLLLLEEPELSLHSAIVRQLAPFIARAQRGAAGRQAFISTHSDSLMADDGISANEVLLVRPVKEGSEVILGADNAEIRGAMQLGLTPAEAIMPITSMSQIELFASAEA